MTCFVQASYFITLPGKGYGTVLHVQASTRRNLVMLPTLDTCAARTTAVGNMLHI